MISHGLPRMAINSQKKLKTKDNTTRTKQLQVSGTDNQLSKANTRTQTEVFGTGNQSSKAYTRTKLEVSGTGSLPSIRKPQVCDDDTRKLRTEVGNGASLTDPAPWNSVDDKALRAALLMERFAGTIFKAKHQVEKSDYKTIQRDKERLEREKRREKARMEAASRKRERDRAAARMEIQAMKKTVEINDAMDIMKEFENLVNTSNTLVSHNGNTHVSLGNSEYEPTI